MAIFAYSEGCPRQVIRYNERIYGLQCHMEMTIELVKGMTEHCLDDLKPGKYIQNTEKMLSTNLSEINEKMFLILDQLAIFIKKQTSEKIIE